MSAENESWLIETGDAVIAKKTASGFSSLSSIERAIYAFWVIDYSVRNSGTLQAAEELHPAALAELNEFARATHCAQLLRICSPGNEADEESFIQQYYMLFDLACAEMQNLYRVP